MTSYAHWHVGMKVVCVVSQEDIDRSQSYAAPGSVYPISNGTYTIREIRDDFKWRRGDHHIVLLLQEIDNRHLIGLRVGTQYCYVEPGFPITGFRPVQTRKTDISIFTAMLQGDHSKVDA